MSKKATKQSRKTKARKEKQIATRAAMIAREKRYDRRLIHCRDLRALPFDSSELAGMAALGAIVAGRIARERGR